MFIALLEETAEMWNIRISAYCLMPNYYHLLLQTPDGNISRGMRHINGVYTQQFNRKHGVDGPLFFVDWIKGGYYDLKADDEVPQAKTLAPAPGMIIDEVCAFYDVQPDDLNKTQRGMFNEPRNAAVYLMRKIRRDRLTPIFAPIISEIYK